MKEGWAVRRALGRVVLVGTLLAVVGVLILWGARERSLLPGVLLGLAAPVVGLMTAVGWRGAAWAGDRPGRRLVLVLGLWGLAAAGLVVSVLQAAYAWIMLHGASSGRFALEEATAAVQEVLEFLDLKGALSLALLASVVSGGVARGLPGFGSTSPMARAPYLVPGALVVAYVATGDPTGKYFLLAFVGQSLLAVPLAALWIELWAFLLDLLMVLVDALWLRLRPEAPPPHERGLNAR